MQWYALRSKPNKEMTLWRELCARGVDCFYPRLSVRPANPRSRTSRPYFPGYMFVQTDIDQAGVSMFQWVPFSLGLISFGGSPACVPDNLIQAIRRRVDEINACGAERPARLEPGEAVIIRSGPFTGYEAIFDMRLSGNDRVRVLLKMMHARQVEMDLPAAWLERNNRR